MDPFATPRQRRHRLKVWPEPYAAVAAGTKTFEWRRDDRPFHEGDWLTLEEWRPSRHGDQGGSYTGRTVTARIGYLLRGPEFGVPVGWVVLSLLQIPKPRKPTKGGRVRMGDALTDSQRVTRQPAKGARITTVRGGLPTLGKKR